MMNSFVGMINLKDNIVSFHNTIEKMNQTLLKKEPVDKNYFEKEHILLGTSNPILANSVR